MHPAARWMLPVHRNPINSPPTQASTHLLLALRHEQACQLPPLRNGYKQNKQTGRLTDAGRSYENGRRETELSLRAVLTMGRNRHID